jgi:hypothetical protein
MSVDGVSFEAAWLNKRRVSLGGIESWVISPQDLIANKKCSGRHRDLADVESIEAHLGLSDES